ncbi:gntR family transcriptional regulator [Streptomyces laurentii]|uniref:GntR family transcriptional regulator n=1 Tax=Streptomyces laurentii TaxID=39478 RepID=A0A160P404_STRLU|nr:gntR family transcriptional regulator [Streptomyces laurentii]
MANEWATFGSDLHLDLAGRGRRKALMDALREAVRSGRLTAGTRLPSSRSLAADLGMARNTVADAYAELTAEGWLTARQGSGTRVAPRSDPRAEPRRRAAVPPRPLPPAGATPGVHAYDLPPGLRMAGVPAYDLLAGRPDVASFPRGDWLKAARKALTAAPNDAFGYGDPRGRIELRTALAEYLARARGVHARPDRIVVCSGFVHGLQLMGRVLHERGVRAVGVDSFGLRVHRDLLVRQGLRVPAVGLDEQGTRTEELRGMGGIGAVLMTPAHQFPLGGALTPARRAAAVDWARSAGGLILEDDYDGEFRYDRQPVGALQGLDPERVVYFGTASKSLAPGLRLAWMVLPEHLADEVAAAKGDIDWVSGSTEQLTFAEFLASGAYDRHVRAMRLRYRRRRDQLVAAVAAHAPGIRVRGIAAGLHAVLELPPGTEQSTLRTAAAHGVALLGVARFRHPDAPPVADGVVVGYGTPPDSAWSGALEALMRVLP